ncbi:hypothetical protein [Pseudomonas japonica]|uniref:hypothetical protein n=1 Tax=Pseudomonas japonica TaxID=256466 RepID=UPI0015E397CB|nr:hypothetical protein [Pseudomonas japonica]MBA1244933.1 hypothetical protein [Pseudomonas japonica]
MFRTQDGDLIGIPGMFGEGVAQWRAVSRLLKTHWYHLTVRGEENGRSAELAWMVEGEQELQRMLISQDANIAITEICVVTPSWMNKRGRWNMETVTKITIGEDVNGCTACLLEVEGGAVYHNSHQPGFRPDLLANLRPIFLSSMIRGS